MTTSTEIHQALAVRYGKGGPDARRRDEWVLIPEARIAAGFSGNARACDLLALNSWESRLHVVGHEIKVSRSDWLKELANPQKAEDFIRYCHDWWMVTPENIIQPGELPPTWGHLVYKNGKLRVAEGAKRNRQPSPPPWTTIVAWISGVDRRQSRASTVELQAEYQKGVEHGQKAAHDNRDRRLESLEQRAELITKIGKAIGVDMWRMDSDDKRLAQLGTLWNLTGQWNGLNGLASTLDHIHNLGNRVASDAVTIKVVLESATLPVETP